MIFKKIIKANLFESTRAIKHFPDFLRAHATGLTLRIQEGTQWMQFCPQRAYSLAELFPCSADGYSCYY